jgi:hypothetical protein
MTPNETRIPTRSQTLHRPAPRSAGRECTLVRGGEPAPMMPTSLSTKMGEDANRRGTLLCESKIGPDGRIALRFGEPAP